MTDYIIHGQTLTDIADGIRAKNPNVTGLIDPADMKADILAIPSGGSVYAPTNIKIQKYFNEQEIGQIATTDELIYTDWIYLESAGTTIVPTFPSDNLANKLVVSDVQNPTDDTVITNATIFYLFSDDIYPRARGSYPNEITYSGSHNTQQAPAKIYSYDPTGAFEWTEITIDSTTWNNKGYDNYVDRIVYSNCDVVRNTVASNVYLMLQNIISETGKISNVYKTDYFDVYYCTQGTQVNSLGVVTQKATIVFIGNMTLLSLYTLLTGGSFPPNNNRNSGNVNIMHHQEFNLDNIEEIKEETKKDENGKKESFEDFSELDA